VDGPAPWGRPDLIRRARWGGAEPFDAYRFTVATVAASYDFVVPKACGNLALVAQGPGVPAPPPPASAAAVPAPAVPPAPIPPPPVASPWYVGADLGYVDIADGSYDFTGAAVIPHRAGFDGGLGYFAQVGRAFGHARVELEFGRRENDTDRFGSINNITAARGSLNATSLMVNALYDFPIGERFVPYLGIGIGGAEVDADNPRKAVTDPDRTGALRGDDGRFAWQLLAGVAFRLNEHWELKLDYRYFDAGDAELDYGVGCDAGGRDCIFVGSLEEPYDAHAISAGARYRF